MAQESVPRLVVSERTEVALSLLGLGAAIAASYYAGQTGNWQPLMAVSMVLALVVLFVTSERS